MDGLHRRAHRRVLRDPAEIRLMTRDRLRRTNDGYYGDGYWLIDNRTNGLVLGEQIARGVNIGYHLDAVEEWLRDMAKLRPVLSRLACRIRVGVLV